MRLKILTVDDSKTIRMIVKKAFRPYDCQVFEAENGVEGLSAVNAEKPDLIILDITMPVMNGIEMLEKLRSVPEFQDIPVIMLTAESGKENVMRIVKMGVKDYLVKPFKDVQLIEKAEKVVTLAPKTSQASKDKGGENYFVQDGDVCVLKVPEAMARPQVLDIENGIGPNLSEMKKQGSAKLVIDLLKVQKVNVSLIKTILLVFSRCQEAGVGCRLVGQAKLQNDLKGFKETSEIPVYVTLDEAKGSF